MGTSSKLTLGGAEKRHLELAPAQGAWSSLQFPQNSWWPHQWRSCVCGGDLPTGLRAVLFHGPVCLAGAEEQGLS